MQISELNEIRERMHKQFINRLPADKDTVKFMVGIGANGVTKEKEAVMLALAENVAEVSNNALVMFDSSFDNGVKILKGGEVFFEEKVCEKCAAQIVNKYLA